MAQMRLPSDIFEEVVDILIDENSRDLTGRIRKALKACALVSGAVLPRVRRHLFASVRVKAGTAQSKLHHLLQYPRLANYVLHLSISVNFGQVENLATQEQSALASILSSTTIPNLRSLELFSTEIPIHYNPYNRSSFFNLSKELLVALLTRFRTLVSLEIRYIYNLPMKYIASCVGLRELKISSTPPRTSHLETEEQVADLMPTDTHQICQLERLAADRYTCVEPFISGHHQLKVLRLVSYWHVVIPLPSIIQLLRDSRHTLEKLDIQPFLPSPHDASLILDFPSLKSLYLGTVIDIRSNEPEWRLDSIASLLESGDVVTPRSLKKLNITINVEDPRTITSYEAWRRIDAALSHPRYSEFADLQVYFISIGAGWEYTEANAGAIATVEASARRTLLLSLYALNQNENVNIQVDVE
ncbi:hypothetical protein H0H87_008094 [Tephrocybe sp. NHM501043]|nr:hypothetical protein H0H87_008094 [Tephrocybe sp. NHM501043]